MTQLRRRKLPRYVLVPHSSSSDVCRYGNAIDSQSKMQLLSVSLRRTSRARAVTVGVVREIQSPGDIADTHLPPRPHSTPLTSSLASCPTISLSRS